MKQILNLLIFLLPVSLGSTSEIYSHQFITLKGEEISLSVFQGKKTLIVNIASESIHAANQLIQLEQLYQQFKDSVEVIAFPSNDFGNEPRTNEDLALLMKNTYHANFFVSTKVGVSDSLSNTAPLYEWLQNSAENGSSDVKVMSDFKKYLISGQGNIIGIFSAEINPLDSVIVNAILN